MKQKFTFALYFFLLSIACNAQNQFTIQWSKWYQKEVNVTPYAYFGQEREAHYGLLKEYVSNYSRMSNGARIPKPVTFFKMNHNGEFEITKEIMLTYNGETADFETSLTLNDNYYIIGKALSKDKKSASMLAYRINKMGEVSNTPVKMMDLPVSENGYYSFDIYQEKNADSFFVISTEATGLSDGSFRLMRFNEQCKNLGSKDFKFPSDKGYEAQTVKIAKNKLYWLGERELSPDDITGTRYLLSIYNLTNYEVNSLPVNHGKNSVRDIHFDLDALSNPIISGFSSKDFKTAYGMVDGFFVIKYNSVSGKEVFNTQKDFPLNFLLENTSEKRANQGLPILKSLNARELINREDGSIAIIAEQAEYYPRLEYGSIVTVSISARGEIEWFKTIRNIQGSVVVNNIKYYSYVVGLSGGDLYFMYNENNDNENRPDPLKYAALNECHDANTTLSVIDRAGKLSRQTVFKEDNEKHETCIEPINTLKVSEDAFILYRTSNKKAKVGLLKLGK